MVYASMIFAAAGLAALTIVAGSKPKNCTMTRNSDGSTTVTALGCSIRFPVGCEDCGAYFDPGHDQKVLECAHFGKTYKDWCKLTDTKFTDTTTTDTTTTDTTTTDTTTTDTTTTATTTTPPHATTTDTTTTDIDTTTTDTTDIDTTTTDTTDTTTATTTTTPPHTTATTTTTTTRPHAYCHGTTCEMIAPYGKMIKDEEVRGYLPSTFTTWDDCRLGCQVNSPLCQSFTFGKNDSKAQECKNGTETGCKCTWYKPAGVKCNQSKLIWIFNMGVQTFSFAEDGSINHGTVRNLVVNTIPVHDNMSTDKITCEQTYADLWQSIKAKKSTITLGQGEHLIGGFTVGGGMPNESEWFGIDVPLPPAFFKVSIFYNYNKSKCSELQRISSDPQDYSPKCDGKYLVADGSTIKLVPASDSLAKTFRWSMPLDNAGVFTWVDDRTGQDTMALRVENHQLTLTSQCENDDAECGLITYDWEDKVFPGNKIWDFYQIGLYPPKGLHQKRGCIETKVGKCEAPLNAIEESSSNDYNCDKGWQFSPDDATVNQYSLQATREQGRCVFYKISSSSEKLQQPPSTTTDPCPICAKRFGNFACVTNETSLEPVEQCKLTPSATFCRDNLNGRFCHSKSTSCHMEGGTAVATFNDTEVCRVFLYQGCYWCTAHDDKEHNEKYVTCKARSDGKVYNAPCPREEVFHI